jgi:hypothetical protein
LISVLPRLFRRYGWVATSALTLGEPIGVGQIAALIFTLAGVALATR